MNCWLFHKFGKWESYIWRGAFLFTIGWQAGQMVPIVEERQKRECQKCGKIEHRKVTP